MSQIIKSVAIQQLLRTYNIPNNRAIIAKNQYEGKIDQTVSADVELYKSSLGTPVVADLTFETTPYYDFNKGRTLYTPKVVYQTILMNVSQPSVIVKTEIQGRNGTVKEYIGKGDYIITINGIITGANGHHPADEITILKKLKDAPIALKVTSSYLNNLDIFYLVVDDFAMDQEPGGYSKQNFTLNCISDEPIELQAI